MRRLLMRKIPFHRDDSGAERESQANHAGTKLPRNATPTQPSAAHHPQPIFHRPAIFDLNATAILFLTSTVYVWYNMRQKTRWIFAGFAARTIAVWCNST